MNTQVASDILELADLCGWDKKQFADVADFIVNRILTTNKGGGLRQARSADELRSYVFQLEQAGGQLQPLSREDAYQAYLPCSNNPFLIDKLLGRDGVAVSNKRCTKKPVKRKYDATLGVNHVRAR